MHWLWEANRVYFAIDWDNTGMVRIKEEGFYEI